MEVSKEGLGGLSERFPGLTAEYYREPYREVTLSVSVRVLCYHTSDRTEPGLPFAARHFEEKEIDPSINTHTHTHART